MFSRRPLIYSWFFVRWFNIGENMNITGCHGGMLVIVKSYLPRIGRVYFCLARTYSTTIVNTTVVLRRVVYMGTFTPRTDSMVTSFQVNRKNVLTIMNTDKPPQNEQTKLQWIKKYHVKQIGEGKRWSVNQCLQWHQSFGTLADGKGFIAIKRNKLPASQHIKPTTWTYHLPQIRNAN